jgi:hypothetical protein
LKTIFETYGIEGVDLDIEEQIPLQDAVYLVKRFKQDFGNGFLVSMAPVYPAMTEGMPRYHSSDVDVPSPPTITILNTISQDQEVDPIKHAAESQGAALKNFLDKDKTTEDLDVTETETEDNLALQRDYLYRFARSRLAAGCSISPFNQEIVKKCSRAYKRNGVLRRNLSGFSYAALRLSEAGPLVDWYNVQAYCGWGNPLQPDMYTNMVKAGWEPSKLVIGTVTSWTMCQGYVDPKQFGNAMRDLMKQYADFGGVMGWEYYHPQGEHWQWADIIGEHLQPLEMLFGDPQNMPQPTY